MRAINKRRADSDCPVPTFTGTIPDDMRTKDGFDVPWNYSGASITSLTKTELEALVKGGDAASKCVALAKLSGSQFRALFSSESDFAGKSHHAKRRLCGKRILEYDVQNYCSGIGDLKLWRAMQIAKRDKWDRKTLIRELLKWT